MSNVYMVRDNRIAFACGEVRPNGMYTHTPLAVLTTKYGVLVPTSPVFANFLDYRADGVSDNINHDSRWITAVVDEHGVLRDYFVDKENSFLSEVRIMTGPGVLTCRSQYLTAEEHARAALELTDTLEDAVMLFCKATDAKEHQFVIRTFDELAALASNFKMKGKNK